MIYAQSLSTTYEKSWVVTVKVKRREEKGRRKKKRKLSSECQESYDVFRSSLVHFSWGSLVFLIFLTLDSYILWYMPFQLCRHLYALRCGIAFPSNNFCVSAFSAFYLRSISMGVDLEPSLPCLTFWNLSFRWTYKSISKKFSFICIPNR